jgi:hypothetical protein
VGGEKNTVEIKGSVLQPESLQDLRLHIYDGKTGAPSSGPYGRRGFLEDLSDAGLCVKQIRIKPDKRILGQRKSIVEHPFGTIKRSMDAAYCLTRGLRNVAGEFSLTFLAYNLKRVITILGCKKLMECLTG